MEPSLFSVHHVRPVAICAFHDLAKPVTIYLWLYGCYPAFKNTVVSYEGERILVSLCVYGLFLHTVRICNRKGLIA